MTKFDAKIDPRGGYIYRHYVRTVGESRTYKARRVTAIDRLWKAGKVTFIESGSRSGGFTRTISTTAFRRWAQDSEVLKYDRG